MFLLMGCKTQDTVNNPSNSNSEEDISEEKIPSAVVFCFDDCSMNWSIIADRYDNVLFKFFI